MINTIVYCFFRLELTIAKRDTGGMWPEIIQGDANRGEYVADPELVQEMAERLAAFTTDHEVYIC